MDELDWICIEWPIRLFLLFSASGKFFKPDGMEVNVTPLGWRMDQMTSLGIVEG